MCETRLALFGVVLWHINLCRLFNAKSIFIHKNSSIPSNSIQCKYSFFAYIQFKCQKQFYFKQLSLALTRVDQGVIEVKDYSAFPKVGHCWRSKNEHISDPFSMDNQF